MIKLRHSVAPYVGMGLASLLGLIVLAAISIMTRDWKPILQLGWFFPVAFGALIALGMQYRVSYSDNLVQMNASGLPQVSIPFGQISHIENEVSVERGRPFRRIAIYAGKRNSGAARVDVSLKHFRIEDIRGLLVVLAQKRSDLSLPKL